MEGGNIAGAVRNMFVLPFGGHGLQNPEFHKLPQINLSPLYAFLAVSTLDEYMALMKKGISDETMMMIRSLVEGAVSSEFSATLKKKKAISGIRKALSTFEAYVAVKAAARAHIMAVFAGESEAPEQFGGSFGSFFKHIGQQFKKVGDAAAEGASQVLSHPLETAEAAASVASAAAPLAAL